MSSADRFGYEWSKFHEITPEYEQQFLRWVSPLKPQDFKNKIILDAGCGIGRNSLWPLKYGAKKVIAFDFDEKTVAVAKNNLFSYKNADVRYASIYDISYRNQFDVVMCIGVIHHLGNPREAIEHLIQAVKRGGILISWVYGYEGNEWIIRYINPIRKVTSMIPIPVTYFITLTPSLILFLLLKIYRRRHPYLKLLSSFHFWHVHSIVFDQLLPKIANYWKKEDVEKLFYDKRLRQMRIMHTNGNSWTVIARKV